jgi:NAD(P)-dependent dehydrogenase (short-subunit alcohol dehydrogenase family)
VIATCRQPLEADSLQSLLKEGHEDRLIILSLEVTSAESHDNLKAQLSAKNIHTIDILIANAGVNSRGLASTCTVEAMRHDFETNVIGSMLTLQTYKDLVLASRLKIFSVMSSVLGSVETLYEARGSGAAAYRVSKTALNMFAVNFSVETEMKNAGCKMLMLHPGWVQTDMGGKSADISLEESCAGLLQVFQTTITLQNRAKHLEISPDPLSLEAALIANPAVYVDYRGEIIPW